MTFILKNIHNIARLKECIDDIYHLLHRNYRGGNYLLPEYWLVPDLLYPRCEQRWRIFSIPRNGDKFDRSGKFRIICAPTYGLGIFLKCVKVLLESAYYPLPCATAYHKGGGIITNAQRHVGQKWVYNIDLKDFFFHINKEMIQNRLLQAPFKFRPRVAEALARVCCVEHSIELKRKWGCFLPQGSPVSPLLSNAVCDKMDRELQNIALHFNYHYSRYADDITFSGAEKISDNSNFVSQLNLIIEK